jgi:biopolymer transport protein TolR
VKPRTYHALSEINVTNLVDVVLVLLIIFMITAPLLQSGIEVRLPPTTAAAEETSEGIVVTITKEGGVFVNDVYRTPDQWEGELERLIRSKPGQKAYLRADADVGYGLVIQVLGTMRKLGLTEVGLVTQPTLEEPKPEVPKVKWG